MRVKIDDQIREERERERGRRRRRRRRRIKKKPMRRKTEDGRETREEMPKLPTQYQKKERGQRPHTTEIVVTCSPTQMSSIPFCPPFKSRPALPSERTTMPPIRSCPVPSCPFTPLLLPQIKRKEKKKKRSMFYTSHVPSPPLRSAHSTYFSSLFPPKFSTCP